MALVRGQFPLRPNAAEQDAILPPDPPPPDNGLMEARLKALEDKLPELATKADVGELKAELRVDAAKLREDFAGLRGDLKASVADLRADMHKADSAHKTWILATVLTVLGSMIALGAFLRATIAPAAAPQAQQQPIIINVPGAAAAPMPGAPASKVGP